MLIGIISDTHDRVDYIMKAIEIFKREKVEALIHCGDYVAPFALVPFQKLDCPFYGVFGNNDGEKKGLLKKAESLGELKNPPHIFKLGEKSFLVNHSPLSEEDIRRRESSIDYFLCGHTHEAEEKMVGSVKFINPGEACGWVNGKATLGLLDTNTDLFNIISLDN